MKVDQVEAYVAVDKPRGGTFYRKFGFESCQLNVVARMPADGTITPQIRAALESDGAEQMLAKLHHGGLL
ncbi:MAG TPA: hypothetical protein VMU26_22830 [Candidatus Polarisedimenticolia bacterium]|nr:hypothetical protein [Candidatus Polarisedimenticolia bacterium]